MSGQNDKKAEYERLAKKYTPLLVLYPEIEKGPRSEYHHDVDNKPGPTGPRPGHPRDINLVLDNARLPVRARFQDRELWRHRKGMTKRELLLEAMSRNKISHIDLIDWHGPQQVDKFWNKYAEVMAKDKKGEDLIEDTEATALAKDTNKNYRRKAYARVVEGDKWFKDYISIQYWLAYFFDDWANVHEMDWEMVSVILKKTDTTEEPVTCVFCSHIGAFRMPWKNVDKADEDGNRNPTELHPIAYVANGSHASYFSDYPSYFNVSEPYLRSGLRTVIRALGIARPFTDYVPRFEEGVKLFPEIEVIPDEKDWTGEWRWLKFTGKWGSPVELSFIGRFIARIPLIRHLPMFFQRPIQEAGPPGPGTRGTCWENPFNWINLECFDAPENQNWIGTQYQEKRV